MIDAVVCSAAEAEYAEALSWYADRSIQAALRFEAQFADTLSAISSDPARQPTFDGLHRYYLMRHFPYQVIYRPHQDHVVIIALAHTARKPRYWSKR